MRNLLLAGATVALLIAVNFAPAMAQAPKLSGGNSWAGVYRRVDTSSTNAAAATAHHEYHCGYGKHAAWRGHWVPVRWHRALSEDCNEPAMPSIVRQAAAPIEVDWV